METQFFAYCQMRGLQIVRSEGRRGVQRLAVDVTFFISRGKTSMYAFNAVS